MCFAATTVSYISDGKGLDLILFGLVLTISSFLITRSGFYGSRLIAQYKKYKSGDNMMEGIKKVSIFVKQVIYWAELIAGVFLQCVFKATTVSYISDGKGLDLIPVWSCVNHFFVSHNTKWFFYGSRLIAQYKKYNAILAVDSDRSLEHLASVSHVPVYKLQKQLEKMIKRGYFGSAYIEL